MLIRFMQFDLFDAQARSFIRFPEVNVDRPLDLWMPVDGGATRNVYLPPRLFFSSDKLGDSDT
jgi:hypothetical protein